MANSRYEYVKSFELSDKLLPHCWIVIRLDGRAFTKFSGAHGFAKPNDAGALALMNHCAVQCCRDFPDIVLAYGESDEFSFVLRKTSTLYDRRASKLVSVVTSLFTATYVHSWAQFLPQQALQYPPCFDGRVVCYPNDTVLRDYLAWRQADCHINNQYNTCFWALVQQAGMTATQAQAALKGTVTKEKNELLFTRFGINYNTLSDMFRKGSIVYRKKVTEESTRQPGDQENSQKQQSRTRYKIVVEHVDIIGDSFWQENPHIMQSGQT